MLVGIQQQTVMLGVALFKAAEPLAFGDLFMCVTGNGWTTRAILGFIP